MSPISGRYFISENDLVVRGTQPLPLPRKYLSHDQYGQGGWGDYNHLFLRARSLDESYFYISTYDSSGMPLIFGNKNSPKKNQLRIPLNFKAYGGSLLNTALGTIGGRTNLRNAHAEYKKGSCYVYLPDGTVRIYSKKLDRQKSMIADKKCYLHTYCIEKELLPNGNQVFYRWTSDKKHPNIHTIVTNGPHPSTAYAYVQYDSGVLKTSDGREVSDEFSLKHHNLTSVKITGLPKEHLLYKKNILIKRSIGEGPFTEIAYNDKKIQTYKDEWKIPGGKHKEKSIREVWPSRAVSSVSDGKGTYTFSYQNSPKREVSKITKVTRDIIKSCG